jgi:hypothetical protein
LKVWLAIFGGAVIQNGKKSIGSVGRNCARTKLRGA